MITLCNDIVHLKEKESTPVHAAVYPVVSSQPNALKKFFMENMKADGAVMTWLKGCYEYNMIVRKIILVMQSLSSLLYKLKCIIISDETSPLETQHKRINQCYSSR